MQPAKPAKPSFLEYFEQKEKEANIHNDGGGKGQNNADNRKLPGEGDLEVVSWKRGAHWTPLDVTEFTSVHALRWQELYLKWHHEHSTGVWSPPAASFSMKSRGLHFGNVPGI